MIQTAYLEQVIVRFSHFFELFPLKRHALRMFAVTSFTIKHLGAMKQRLKVSSNVSDDYGTIETAVIRRVRYTHASPELLNRRVVTRRLWVICVNVLNFLRISMKDVWTYVASTAITNQRVVFLCSIVRLLCNHSVPWLHSKTNIKAIKRDCHTHTQLKSQLSSITVATIFNAYVIYYTFGVWEDK